MTLSRPKVRAGLVNSAQVENGRPIHVVKIPESGRYFRFNDEDYCVLTNMDGKRSAFELLSILKSEHGLQADAGTIERFADRLMKAGLLDIPRDAPGNERVANRTPVTLFRRVLAIRLKAINPDRFFATFLGYLRPLFSPYFVVFASCLIAYSFVIAIAKWNVITAEMSTTFNVRLALWFWICGLVVAVLHECAHGFTCKFHGGEVRELGFLLLYFNLGLYCNVSDAWLFREKSKKLWVTFAGGFFEAFIWASTVVMWQITERNTLVHTLCLITITIAGIKNLFNFLPLIKLDGYYLLSDYLELPNLRQRAFAYVRQLFLNSLGFSRKMKSVTSKEKVAYIIYTMLALPFSGALMALMYLGLSRFVIRKYPSTGRYVVAIFTVLLFGDLILTWLRAFYSWARARYRLRTSFIQS